MEIKVMKNIFGANQKIANENRRLFEERGMLTINVMASPGAGKTSVLMECIEGLRNEYPLGVIEGDIASSIDAEKIEKQGIPVVQINTGGGCHLDANMIQTVVQEMALPEKTILFIENVGNLVCPSSFDLGEQMKLVISSVPEGHDKPFKYISMFEAADLIVLNKIDLLPYIDFNTDEFYKGIKAVNQKAPIIEVSCKTKQGIEDLIKTISNWR